MMKITPLIFETWKMDGGVAFGVVPKSIWNKLYPSDENNLLTIVNRCLLIETEKKKILVNTGYGNKRNEKYYQFKYIQSSVSVKEALQKQGCSTEEITDVVLTHLHDDHCGGTTFRDTKSDLLLPVFENAIFFISQKQWKWALYPNSRESASFFPDNLIPLENSGRLHLIQENEQVLASDNIQFEFVNGHTEGQLLIYMSVGENTVVYMSDFIPSTAHIPLPYIASVDIQPLIALKEKEEFLERAAKNNYILLFEHDFYTEACTIIKGERGYAVSKKGALQDFL